MTIQVTCQCGKKLSAKPQLAGRQVKCPNCGESLVVPGSTQKPTRKALQPTGDGLGDLLDEAGIANSVGAESCPSCRSELDPEALLCVNCGFNRESGKRIKVMRDSAPEDDENLPPQLRRAMKQVKHEKIEKLAEGGEEYTSWILGLVLFGVVGIVMAIGVYCFTLGGC